MVNEKVLNNVLYKKLYHGWCKLLHGLHSRFATLFHNSIAMFSNVRSRAPIDS